MIYLIKFLYIIKNNRNNERDNIKSFENEKFYI